MPTGGDRSQAARRARVRAAAALLLALAVLPYANALRAGFVYDDDGLVRRHPAVQGAFSASRALSAPYWPERSDTRLWRPLTTLSFAIDDALRDDSAAFMHGVNVALHAAVTLALWGLMRRLGTPEGVAFWGAALFAVHPLHTEAVTWISGRAELLAALFGLAALRLATWRSSAAVAACGGLTALAVGSKESAAALPAMLLFLRFAVPTRAPRAAGAAAASLLAVLLYAALRSIVLGDASPPLVRESENVMAGTTLLERLPTVLDATGRYLALLVWPHPLSIDRGPPDFVLRRGPTAFAGLGVVGVLGALALAARARRSAGSDHGAGVAAGLALLAYAVASNLFVVIGTHFAERLFYLPSAFALPCAAALLVRAAGAGARRVRSERAAAGLRAALAAGLPLLLIGAGVRTAVRNADYRDDLTLARATLRVYPQSATMAYNRARELGRLGRHAEALAAARQALDIDPADPGAGVVAANALIGLGRAREAREFLRGQLAAHPGLERSRIRLIVLLEQAGDEDGAAALAEQALALPGSRERLWIGRAALAAERRGDAALALERWRRAAALHPGDAAVWSALGRSAYGAGASALAREAWQRALQIDPQQAEAANGLAWALLDAAGPGDPGRTAAARALALARRAVARTPRADYLDTLARALEAAGDCPAALAAARRAHAAEPDEPAYRARREALEARCAAETAGADGGDEATRAATR